MTNMLSDHSLDSTIEVLLQHSKNKERFKKDASITAVGGENSKDYTNKGIRRSNFSQKKFIKAIFKNSTAAGSNFDSCTFDSCQISNANFQECAFPNSQIINNPKEQSIIGSNFNDSLFSDNFSLENTYFEHCVFYQTAFIGGEIRNTTFYSCTMECTTFSDLVLEDVQFTDLNIDYAVFERVRMHHVVLPFSQICYTFGLLSYLASTGDEVYITSAANEKGYISKEEFLSLLPHFIKYYSETREFFPLANIHFFQKEYEKAIQVLKEGILISVAHCDFRQIKYLCKLISVYSVFDFHKRKKIYDYIYSHISFCDMHPSLLYNYTVYKKEIESYLLSNSSEGIVTTTINITTDVFPDDSERLGVLLSSIEGVIDLFKSFRGEHEILCRHNSAEAIRVTLQEILPALLVIVPSIYYVLMGSMELEEKRLHILSERKNLKVMEERNQLEVENSRLDLEYKKVSLEKEKLELYHMQSEEIERQTLVQREILRNNITEHNINITETNHIMIGNIPSQIDRQLVQHTERRS